MIQEINIRGLPVRYAVNTDNIIRVLGNISTIGSLQIAARVPTFDETLHIIYLGLDHTYGYTFTDFRNAYYRGEIHPYKHKNQYTVAMMRWRILARIRQINREHNIQPAKATRS